MSILLQKFRYGCQCMLAVSQDSYIHFYILVYFRRVDVEVDYFCLFGIGSEIASHTVVKTHADSNQDIAFIGIDIRSQVAVHTQHTLIQRMLRRQSRKTEQRASRRHVRLFYESTQFALRIAQLNALPHQYKRTFGFINQFGSRFYCVLIRIGHRNVTADKVQLRRFVFRFLHLRVLGKVQHYWAGTTATGNIERTRHCPSHIFRPTNLITPFSDWLGDAYQIDFLKSIRPEESSPYLSGNHHNRRAVYHCVRNAGNRVRSTGATCHQANTYFTRYTGITLCRMGSSLFVTNQDVIQRILMVE